MNFINFINLAFLAIALVANFALAFVVLRRDFHSAANRLYFLLSITISTWITALFLAKLSTNAQQILWLARLSIAVATPMSMAFFLLARTLPDRVIPLSNGTKFGVYVSTIIVMIINISPFAFSDTKLLNGENVVIPQIGMVPFVVLSTVFSIAAIYILVLKWRKSVGLERQQFKLIFIGIFLMLALVIGTIMIPILINQNESFIALSPLYTLIFLSFTAYSIIRYHFLDIRIFLRRAFVIGGALIASVAINMNLLYLDAIVFNWLIPAAVAGPIALVLGIGLFEWFRKLFLKFANKYFFTTLYDQQQVLEDLASKMSRTIQLREVVETVSQTISKTLGIEHYGIYFLTKNKNDNYKPQTLIEAGFETNTSQKILNDQFLYSYLSKSNEALVREEMVRFLEEETARPKHTTEHLRIGLVQLIKELKQAGIAVVVPLTSSGNLVSIIFLGNKLTKDAFTVQDIHLLETIADQAAVAIENSRLYEEAQQFTIKLKHEVEKATAELKEANAQLKELDEAKSEFMSIASHQLRTPLAGIVGYLSMLLEGDYGKLTKQNQPVVTDVFQAAQRLVRLVNTFLNVTRIEAGRFTLTYVLTNIVNMINDEVKELQPTADKRNLKLIFNKPKSADLEAEVDEKMREVFINLIDNAIKYTQEGSVTVGVEPEGKADIHLTVTDTGIGIAKGDAEHLFEKFVRGSSVARVQPNGSGLGLYIVKQIVEGHHGKIWAASEGVNKGTTFHVVIPTKQKTKEFKADAKRVFHTESIVNRDPNAPLQQLSAPTSSVSTSSVPPTNEVAK